MYERFTKNARTLLQLANREAKRLNHEYIGTEHVLLGLIEQRSGIAAKVLQYLDVDPRRIRQELERLIVKGPDMAILGILPQTPRTKNVIKYSMEEARSLNHDCVGTEHILLGLLREEAGVASHVLMSLGLTLEEVRKAIVFMHDNGSAPSTGDRLERIHQPSEDKADKMMLEDSAHADSATQKTGVWRWLGKLFGAG